jgi:crossover junction endodeoxyribonuclease RuvC
MLVLGVDPGTRFLGWGVIAAEGNRLRHVGHGVVNACPEKPLAERLVIIDRELAAVIARFRPDCGSVETLFFHKDAQAAAKLGHARGVALLNLARAGIPVAEYAPARVKSMLTGSGRAEKLQVAQMIKMLLSLDELPASDAADALALAVTHLRRAPLEAALALRRAQNPELDRVLGKARRRRVSARQPAALGKPRSAG